MKRRPRVLRAGAWRKEQTMMYRFGLAAGFACLVLGFAATASADVEKGKDVYKAQKCQMCHSIDGVGNKKSPLDGVGAKLTEEQIRKWITSPQEMKADVKKKAFDKLAKEDLDALVAYMKSLK
jgi:mono/diheme cytochrome c family protein